MLVCASMPYIPTKSPLFQRVKNWLTVTATSGTATVVTPGVGSSEIGGVVIGGFLEHAEIIKIT
ncbi:MAG: hypothetical protein Q8R87_09960, partial [Anaerolineaceae bacterium]|nr:hypothetical protein [Anaerolineaceae bacterium]